MRNLLQYPITLDEEITALERAIRLVEEEDIDTPGALAATALREVLRERRALRAFLNEEAEESEEEAA